MKLATYELAGQEKWGFLVKNPVNDKDCLVSPQSIEDILPNLCKFSSYFELSKPQFLKSGKWPEDLQGFLEMGDSGMQILQQMYNFVTDYAVRQDSFLLLDCLHPTDSIRFKAPIPRPRVYWGLVQNCPSFFRNDPNRTLVSLYCQGHQRTQATCVGHNGLMILEGQEEAFPADFTVELGVVIGKQGRHIQAKDAINYVAGYTIVIDGVSRRIQNDFGEDMGKDWYINATASWVGKKTDTMAPMGPYLITKDEVLNPYDLLSYSKQNGAFRDRGFSGELILGIERAIEFYSSFATIYPGDVFHLGAMQVDGMKVFSSADLGSENAVEVGIEQVGDLRVQYVWPHKDDWRKQDDPTRVRTSDAVRELFDKHQEEISLSTFNPEAVRHFWTCFVNTVQSLDEESGFVRLTKTPRILNNPGRAVSARPNGILSSIATEVSVSVEICAIIKKVAHNVSEANVEEYILAYSPMVSMNDHSIYNRVVQAFCNEQEKRIPELYARWGDGYNVIFQTPLQMTHDQIMDKTLVLQIHESQKIQIPMADYIMDFKKIFASLTKYVTLFPGDIISLGHDGRSILIDKETVATKGISGIMGLTPGLSLEPFSFKKEDMSPASYEEIQLPQKIAYN